MGRGSLVCKPGEVDTWYNIRTWHKRLQVFPSKTTGHMYRHLGLRGPAVEARAQGGGQGGLHDGLQAVRVRLMYMKDKGRGAA